MHTDNRDEMRDRIIEAALKRFTHYGASKTTMNEIAEDLHCSKASLYYYFPDKNALHFGVLEKAGETFFARLEKVAEGEGATVDILLEMARVRHIFAKRFCRLELFKVLRDKQIDTTGDVFEQARQRETAMTAKVLQAGIDRGELAPCDVQQMAVLYIQSMLGLRLSLANGAMSDDISEEGFETVRQWQEQFTAIFIKGLKK
ncbi:TetR/AcrR family transcriptional regulator [Chitinophaga lutea]|uniref:TetR/AcrR family transcriptional regulator n=1 Tax=Chitinophaga lutea TaxID=2488634 RepID=A0A3N4Q7M7_9BACT|nr:TetR/AcrR family transcriptional regulator [Chitinophaga lutea]RPE13551.1 TetR/AcrR family transcriptional regulator [Chitinophaga lutea]